MSGVANVCTPCGACFAGKRAASHSVGSNHHQPRHAPPSLPPPPQPPRPTPPQHHSGVHGLPSLRLAGQGCSNQTADSAASPPPPPPPPSRPRRSREHLAAAGSRTAAGEAKPPGRRVSNVEQRPAGPARPAAVPSGGAVTSRRGCALGARRAAVRAAAAVCVLLGVRAHVRPPETSTADSRQPRVAEMAAPRMSCMEEESLRERLRAALLKQCADLLVASAAHAPLAASASNASAAPGAAGVAPPSPSSPAPRLNRDGFRRAFLDKRRPLGAEALLCSQLVAPPVAAGKVAAACRCLAGLALRGTGAKTKRRSTPADPERPYFLAL
ncbi:wiskott-Aldrich syndrome protein homolog 1-like [Schistocerca americana]|uniref:wiskott-Aldrich syndrome protein homolog 1-like n=1 Tax=Schistocerca americana TaxID=7009 RepID=UPI001F4FEC85|nr:wiskott-Aldrich syndrome protein homolog 1-like [Schistocerca americana]